jgi:hypothetical protein
MLNKKLFQCKLLSKRSKLRLYWSAIRSVITYACEARVLRDNIAQKLMRFERKVLTKIYGPTKLVDGTWRIKTHEELDNLIEHKNIIHFIKAQRLRWYGHVERMPEERDFKKIYKWELIASRPVGHPKIGRSRGVVPFSKHPHNPFVASPRSL